MNRRRNLRIPLLLTGELTIGTSSRSIEILDLSLTGAKLRHGATDVGKHCVLTLFVDDGQRVLSITLYGRVVYSEDDTCAISFVETDSDDLRLLAELLSQHSDEPAIVQTELADGAIPAVKKWGQLCV